MYKKFVPRYAGRYLTSNVNVTINGISKPMGSLYRKFTTPINNYTILAFGILFDFTGNDKFVSTCQPVDQLIKESWFQNVLKKETNDVDVIVVVGHTPLRNSTGFEYDLVLSEIRRHLPTMPVQFFGGHTHIRDFRKYDGFAHGIESGRYLETLGWIGMDLKPFQIARRYIDNNVDGYRFHAGIRDEQPFETKEGLEISREIQQKVRTDLKLD
jgi:2',3'-cyclic-nucleotide 2'-phosphodiesterase (5'-nucleotidase family)